MASDTYFVISFIFNTGHFTYDDSVSFVSFIWHHMITSFEKHPNKSVIVVNHDVCACVRFNFQ